LIEPPDDPGIPDSTHTDARAFKSSKMTAADLSTQRSGTGVLARDMRP
jgi:hypothetical protein